MTYYTAKVDTPVSRIVAVIVRAESPEDARHDMISVVHGTFGKSSRVVGPVATCYAPDPMADFPAKGAQANGQQWAWFSTAG